MKLHFAISTVAVSLMLANACGSGDDNSLSSANDELTDASLNVDSSSGAASNGGAPPVNTGTPLGGGGSGATGGVSDASTTTPGTTCGFDNECAWGQTCSDGACADPVACVDSNDCRGRTDDKTLCVEGECAECGTAADCSTLTGPGSLCTERRCVRSGACSTGSPSGSDGGADAWCQTGEVCDVALGLCVECLANDDCDAGKTCSDGRCFDACASDRECTAPALCDTTAGVCVECVADTSCADVEHCSGGRCVADVCAQGRTSCVNQDRVTCTANGSGYGSGTPCAANERCTFNPGADATCEPTGEPLPPPSHCTDGEKSGDESDTDCGGSCAACADDSRCDADRDCESQVCQGCTGFPCLINVTPRCRAASCNDGAQNGSETDVDCGGSCRSCGSGQQCVANEDCDSGVCTGGTCDSSTCDRNACGSCLIPTFPCCTSDNRCGCAALGAILCSPIGQLP